MEPRSATQIPRIISLITHLSRQSSRLEALDDGNSVCLSDQKGFFDSIFDFLKINGVFRRPTRFSKINEILQRSTRLVKKSRKKNHFARLDDFFSFLVLPLISEDSTVFSFFN